MGDDTTYDKPLTGKETRRRAGVVRQQNAIQQKRDQRAEFSARNEFIERVEKAAKHHPEIDHQVFKDIIAAYDAEYAAYTVKEAEIKKNSVKAYQDIDHRALRTQVMENIHKRIEHHKGAGTAALHAIAEENQPESFFTPIVRMFYNSDKGGFQIGGAAGAALAGGLAYYFSSSAGTSSLLTYGITAAATLLGAYAGSQAFGGKDTVPTPNFKTPMVAQGPVKSPEIATGSPDLDKKRTGTMPDVKLPTAGVGYSPGKDPKTTGYYPSTSPVSTEPEEKSR